MSEAMYLIITAKTLQELQARVSKSVRERYEPCGGVIYDELTDLYIQAAFKPEPEAV